MSANKALGTKRSFAPEMELHSLYDFSTCIGQSHEYLLNYVCVRVCVCVCKCACGVCVCVCVWCVCVCVVCVVCV